MPTGVPIPDVRAQLLDAGCRVLRRDGPDALTSRAVTTEAGLAKGILYRHFADFDTFLASLALTRLRRLDDESERLRSIAGDGSVAGNVAAALTASLDPDSLSIVTLVLSRRELLARMRLTTPAGIPLLSETTRMVAAYLTAERGLGRISPAADIDALATALVGSAHLLLAGADDDVDSDRVRELIVAIADLTTTGARHETG